MPSTYTITIEPPENEKAPMWSAFCKEWGFVAEDRTPQDALMALLEAISVAENRKQKITNYDFNKTFSKTTFKIPALA